jgi:hypothetical protein
LYRDLIVKCTMYIFGLVHVMVLSAMLSTTVVSQFECMCNKEC